MSEIAQTIGESLCTALLGFHAFSGCDSVSAFASRGKLSGYKLLAKNLMFQETFKSLGQDWNVSEDLYSALEHFTCHLYSSSTKTKSVNELRYMLFCAKREEVESFQLPPCNDCLRKHIQRSNYQTAVWKSALHNDAVIPSPVGRGWKIEKIESKDALITDWMDGQSAPRAVLDLIACNCTRVCKQDKCECIKNGLKCTDMCKLLDCDNQASAIDSDVEEIDLDDDDFDEEEN